MTDMAELIGDPTELGVVEAVWLCGHHGIPANVENVEWYVLRFWDEGHHEPIPPQDARQYIASAVDAGEVAMHVSPDLEAMLTLTSETAAKVALRYDYWSEVRRTPEEDVCEIVQAACERYYAECEGEWPTRGDLVRYIAKLGEAPLDAVGEMVTFAVASGAVLPCLDPSDPSDYPELARALEVLRPFWRWQPNRGPVA